jgi:hypothetical protein
MAFAAMCVVGYCVQLALFTLVQRLYEWHGCTGETAKDKQTHGKTISGS